MQKNKIDYKAAIKNSGKTIYNKIKRTDKALWIPDRELEKLLQDGLNGTKLYGLPLRTRSKVVKSRVCESLGYPVPSNFQKLNQDFRGKILTPTHRRQIIYKYGMKKLHQQEGMP